MADIIVNLANDDGTGLDSDSNSSTLSLSEAILKANTDDGADRIILQNNVTVTGVMKRLLNSDITITGDDPNTAAVETRSISGGDSFRPLFVKSGTITLENLTLTNGKVKGGSSSFGGGGAGMGGALFVYGGTVTVKKVAFSGNQAIGGNGNMVVMQHNGA
jgi:hypothetical protein